MARAALTHVLDVTGVTHALIDLERREAAAELFQTAGIRRGQRTGALLTSLAAGLMMALITMGFRVVFGRAPAVAFFIPSVITVAGSAAMRAVTTGAHRVNATGRRPWKDQRNTVCLGVAGFVLAGAVVAGWLKFTMALAVGCSLGVACAAGMVLGHIIPRLVHRWRLDPKIASGPLVCAFADIVALSCYLLASTLLV